MIIAIDVHYKATYAKAVGVVFDHWNDAKPTAIVIEDIKEVAPYVPGEFYKRELPCIMALLKKVDPNTLSCIVVDGFVFLDDTKRLGLGAHLFETLQKKIPIIGVAKTGFHGIETLVREVVRGESKNPLFITAEGIDIETASNNIQRMHGNYRMPTLLKEMDRLTKIE